MKYTKVIIKSADDLPKEKERYIAHMKHTDSIRDYPYHGTKVSTKLWIEGIDWYLIEDKEQEIIKALSGEEIEDVPTFTSTEYPIEDYVVYDKEHSEKLEIRQEIIKAHTFEGKCTISECRINQLLEGAVWYRDWVRG